MWTELIPKSEITYRVTEKTVDFASRFGRYLGRNDNDGKQLTTSQLRKFFGEVKRQQMQGFDQTRFILLKPKLAYAVGRVVSRNDSKFKIVDFYRVISSAIDEVTDQKSFNNFTNIFEAIVAYHKVSEEGEYLL